MLKLLKEKHIDQYIYTVALINTHKQQIQQIQNT